MFCIAKTAVMIHWFILSSLVTSLYQININNNPCMKVLRALKNLIINVNNSEYLLAVFRGYIQSSLCDDALLTHVYFFA